MSVLPNKHFNCFSLSPLLGIIIFVLLYVWAAYLYPGGSQVDKQAPGFSWRYNYWCDLFDPIAHNGAPNPSRPIAIGAMVVLTVCFAGLFHLIPRLFYVKTRRQRVIPYTGVASMMVAVFLFTPYHETVINLAGLLGSTTLIIIFIELYKARYICLFITGLFCLSLSAFNYFIYETGLGISLLAVTQKITFLLFFIWAGSINLVIYRVD